MGPLRLIELFRYSGCVCMELVKGLDDSGQRSKRVYDDNDDNDNDKQFIFRHVCPYNIKRDIHYVQC